jgi:hypothetical protein
MPTSLPCVTSDWHWLGFIFFISNFLRNQNADGLSTLQSSSMERPKIESLLQAVGIGHA